MKTLMVLMGVFLLVGAVLARPPDRNWTMDFSAAEKKAAAEKKPMFVLFTGSDWCTFCMQLDKKVLGKSAFRNYAKEKLILVYVDFPRRKLAAEQTAANRALAGKFKVSGYPTAILLDSAGKEVARFRGFGGDGAAYLRDLQTAVDRLAAAPPEKKDEKKAEQ